MPPDDPNSDESADGQLSPHPLVSGLFGGTSGGRLERARTSASEPGSLDAATDESVTNFLNDRDRPELVILSGYLAGCVNKDEQWHVLFLDETAESYVLVRPPDIHFHNRIDVDGAPFGKVDLLWVKAEASVLRGTRGESVTARITNGSFVRARDFRASLTGGTMAGMSELGPLCTALTPCCCNKLSP